MGEIDRHGRPNFSQKLGRVGIGRLDLSQKSGRGQSGKAEDIPTLPDFRLKIGEGQDWP